MFVAVIGITASCSDSDSDSALPAPAFSSDEVEELFVRWACPANPLTAFASYEPTGISDPLGRNPLEWVVRTRHGEFTAREPEMTFVPSDQAAGFAGRLRAGDECLP